jgi:hypothetical protein
LSVEKPINAIRMDEIEIRMVVHVVLCLSFSAHDSDGLGFSSANSKQTKQQTDRLHPYFWEAIKQP